MGLFSKIGSFTADALLGVGGNLVGNALNGVFNSKANSKSFEQQKALMDKQFDQQLRMYQEGPQAQVAGYRSAGLNPYLMAGGNAGTASVSSAPSSPVNPTQVDLTPSTDIIRDMMRMNYEKRMQDVEIEDKQQDVEAKKKDNAVRDVRNQTEIDNIKADTKDKDTRAALTKVQEELARTTFSDDVARVKFENMNLQEQAMLIRAQALNQSLQADLLKLDIDHYDERFTQELGLMAAQTYAAVQAGNLSEKQAEHEIEKKVETIARATGVKIDNYQKNKIGWMLREKARADMQTAKENIGPNNPYSFAEKYVGEDALNVLPFVLPFFGVLGKGAKLVGAKGSVRGAAKAVKHSVTKPNKIGFH